MKNKKTILVSGSLVYDRIMDFPGKFADHIMPDKIHILNVAFAVNGLRESFGGTAGNIAYNLALLGEKPTILSTVGHDFLPYKKWLLKNKIDVSRVKMIKERKTASCYIITDKADNQITGFHADALNEESFGKEEISRNLTPSLSFVRRGGLKSPYAPLYKGGESIAPLLKGGMGGFFTIISPGNIKDMENYARFYKKVGIKYIFDPGQAITALKPLVLKNTIKGAEALIGNDYEVSLLSKKTGWTTNNLIDKVNMLIITKGEKGSEIYSRNKTPQPPRLAESLASLRGRSGPAKRAFTRGAIRQTPPFKRPASSERMRGEGARGVIKAIKIPAVQVKKVIDPTGAGDAYRAGFIKGMVEEWDARKCAQLASAVASFAVEKYGTQEHRFSWSEIKQRYKSSYNGNI